MRIAFATISVKSTSTDEAMFGSSSVNMIRSEPAPCAVDASMNSRLRSASTCPRSGLPMYGMKTNEMTAIGIQRLPARDVDGPVVEAVERERGTERDPEQDDREGPDQVEDPRDDPVGSAAEVAREQGEDHRQDGADHRRAEADEERVEAAVEKRESPTSRPSRRRRGCTGRRMRPTAGRSGCPQRIDLAVLPIVCSPCEMIGTVWPFTWMSPPAFVSFCPRCETCST